VTARKVSAQPVIGKGKVTALAARGGWRDWVEWLAVAAAPGNRLIEVTNFPGTNVLRFYRLGT
jgi:hypothetical protein